MRLIQVVLASLLALFCSCKSINNSFYNSKKSVKESVYTTTLKGTSWQLVHIDSAGAIHLFPVDPIYRLTFAHIKYKKEKGEMFAIGRLFIKTEIEDMQAIYYCKDRRPDYKINIRTGEMSTQIQKRYLFMFTHNISLVNPELSGVLFDFQNSVSRLNADTLQGVLVADMIYSRREEVKMKVLLKKL